MRLPNSWWGAIFAAVVGLWAGNAVAQADGAGWFDEDREVSGDDASGGERPLLRIHGSGPYDPPPPDFQSDPDPAPRAPASRADEAAPVEWTDGDVHEDDPEARERALQEFSPHLSRYGRWVDDPYYGSIWVPARRVVGAEFSPYVTGGHWELTVGDEWVWVSDYPFGWITFHYGRWVWTASNWAWVPGYVYAPAWVDFRIGSSGYIGWGPLPPRYVWRSGVFVSLGGVRPAPVIFCPTPYVFSRSLHRHVIHDRHRVRSIARGTYRYRPHRVSGFAGAVRGPTPSEARIPRHALPAERTIARPRVADFSGTKRALRSGQNRSGPDASRYLERRRTGAQPAPAASLRRSAQPPRSGWIDRGRSAPSRDGWIRSDRRRATPAADLNRRWGSSSRAERRAQPATPRLSPGSRGIDVRRAAPRAAPARALRGRWSDRMAPARGSVRSAPPRARPAAKPRGKTPGRTNARGNWLQPGSVRGSGIHKAEPPSRAGRGGAAPPAKRYGGQNKGGGARR